MNKPDPEKWIRKAIFDACNGMVVDTNTINFYDTVLPASESDESNYVIMGAQSSEQIKPTKCEDDWQSDIVLDCTTRYNKSGNSGDRLLVDNIANEVRNRLQSLQLDVASTMKIDTRTIATLSSVFAETDSENIFRKLLRFTYVIV